MGLQLLARVGDFFLLVSARMSQPVAHRPSAVRTEPRARELWLALFIEEKESESSQEVLQFRCRVLVGYQALDTENVPHACRQCGLRTGDMKGARRAP